MQQINEVIQQAEQIIVGKSQVIKLAVCALLAKGHLLIEDIPGVGKTTLAQTLAHLFGLDYRRIQFTSDLLPADILGVSIFSQASQAFEFHPGPVFANVVLADEINRATPKAQSAFLEAMEENQVTAEGETRALPQPFFVIATQNPLEQIGTFPLPESQLDRFLMQLSLGYPDKQAEKAILAGEDRRQMLQRMQPVMSTEQILEIQQRVQEITVADPIVEYVHALLVASRTDGHIQTGLSPRAGIALIQAAKAWAFLEAREFVIPEDIQTVFISVCKHRLQSSGEEQLDSILKRWLEITPVD